MKKLILACLAALFVAVVNAASIQWGSKTPLDVYTKSPNGGDLTTYTAYLCWANTSTALTNTLTALQNGTWSGTNLGTDASRNLLAIGAISVKQSDLTGDIGKGTYDFYVVVLDNTSIETAKYYAVSSIMSGTTYVSGDTPSSVLWSSAESLVAGSNGWNKIGTVPEPTVLALLALGVAGLALKRKVA